MTEPKEGQAGGQPGAVGAGTPPAAGSTGSPPPATGGGQPGQGQVPPAAGLPDDTIVQLAGGETVKLGELKGGYMKDADYRQKTAALAEKERVLDARSVPATGAPGQAGPGYYPSADAMRGGEAQEPPSPEERLAMLEQRDLERTATNFLSSEIDRFKPQYPNADPNAVFDVCWGNPNANIENVMKQDHERIQGAQKAVTFDVVQADPEKKAAYDQQVIDAHEKAKAAKAAGTGFASGDGSTGAVPPEPPKKPGSFEEISKGLKAELAASEDQG